MIDNRYAYHIVKCTKGLGEFLFKEYLSETSTDRISQKRVDKEVEQLVHDLRDNSVSLDQILDIECMRCYNLDLETDVEVVPLALVEKLLSDLFKVEESI